MGIEGGRRSPESHVEGLPRLRALLDKLIVPGVGIIELERLLKIEPQRDEEGNLRYLLTAGLAVELITGQNRPHHDLDLVIMDPRNSTEWEIYGTDNVTPKCYWADMEFDASYLSATARQVMTKVASGVPVEVVHPGILLVQKASDAFRRAPRPKDCDDARALIDHWSERDSDPKSWPPIIRRSLEALPVDEYSVTIDRIAKMIAQKTR